MFMGPTWDPPGDDRTQVGPMLAPWTLLSGWLCFYALNRCWIVVKDTPGLYIETKMPTFRAITHDDVINWKHFPRYWPFVRGIHRSPVNSPEKGQWHRALMFFFYVRLNKWLSKQSLGWWFETPSCPSWRHWPSNILNLHISLEEAAATHRPHNPAVEIVISVIYRRIM